jgi:exonuclease III
MRNTNMTNVGTTSIKPTNQPNPLTLSICTHNVRGLNQDLKKQVWEQYCLENNLNIISLTETKLSNEYLTTKPHKTPHYTYFWSCTEGSKAETALMINNDLTPHIHNIITYPGYAIAIDIFFKHDFKF